MIHLFLLIGISNENSIIFLFKRLTLFVIFDKNLLKVKCNSIDIYSSNIELCP